MPTTIHIPDRILKKVDLRAARLKVSRNHFIVESIEKALASDDDWPRAAVELFKPVSRATARAFDASMKKVKARRTTARPRAF